MSVKLKSGGAQNRKAPKLKNQKVCQPREGESWGSKSLRGKTKKKVQKQEREAPGIGCSGPDTVFCSTRRSVSANKPYLGNLLYPKLFAGWMNGWMNGWRGVFFIWLLCCCCHANHASCSKDEVAVCHWQNTIGRFWNESRKNSYGCCHARTGKDRFVHEEIASIDRHMRSADGHFFHRLASQQSISTNVIRRVLLLHL